MKEMKYTLGLVMINLTCACLYYMKAINDFNQIVMNQTDFIIHLVCMMIWTIAAIMNLIRYLKYKDELYHEC